MNSRILILSLTALGLCHLPALAQKSDDSPFGIGLPPGAAQSAPAPAAPVVKAVQGAVGDAAATAAPPVAAPPQVVNQVPAVARRPARTAPPVESPRVPAAGTASGPAVPGAATDQLPLYIKGTDQTFATVAQAPAPTGGSHTFKFEDAPVLDVAHVILRDVVKADYVVHPPVVGSVTLSTRRPVSSDQALAMLEAALHSNGLALARDSRGVFHLGRPDSLKGVVAVPRVPGASVLPPGTGVVVAPLNFIGASEMAAILKPLLPAESLVRVDSVRNLLVMTGSRPQIEGWLQLIATFDVDLLKGMSVGLFPLKHASVQDVNEALRLFSPQAAVAQPVLPGARVAPATAASAGATGAASAQQIASLAEQFPLHGAIRVLPIERLNAVLIVTPRAHYLEQARQLIERLDKPALGGSTPQLYVYPVQNGSAKHLANVLTSIYGGTPTAGGTTETGVAPGLGTATGRTTTSGFGAAGGAATQTAAGRTTQASAINPSVVSGATLGTGGPRVVADETNNALLIFGTALQFNTIESALKRLDVAPTQVMIEASIVEVTLTDELRYGLQWTFNDSLRNGYSGTGVISGQDGGTLGGALAGLSYTVTNPAGQIRAILNALARKSLVNIISNPSLMVLDNQPAQISVGNQQPIRSAETVTEGGVRSTSIQYKDTGVILNVQPSVNAGNMVTLNIGQTVTDVGEVDEATGQRAFLQRQINSKVAVRSGESVVLGGLIRENSTRGKAGLPVAQDIPLFGALFGSNNTSSNRTELLVVITPRVMRNEQQAQEVGEELRDRMTQLTRLLSGESPAGVLRLPGLGGGLSSQSQ